MMENRVFDYVEALLREVRDTEQEQIEQEEFCRLLAQDIPMRGRWN